MTIMFFLKPSAWTPPSGIPGFLGDGGAGRRKRSRKALRKKLIEARRKRSREEVEILLLLLDLYDT